MLPKQHQHKQALNEQGDQDILQNLFDRLPLKEQITLARMAMNHSKSIINNEGWQHLKSELPF